MTRGKTLLGALFAIALCMSAIGASGAFAAETGYTLHECKERPGGTGTRYSSSTCETKSETGNFETFDLALTNQKVKATGTSEFLLKSTNAGVNFEIKCSTLSAEPTVSNVLTGENMHVTDEGATSFTGCSVVAPAGKGCTVSSTLTTNNLTSDTNATGGTKFEPETGKPFITIAVTGCSNSALNGNKEVKGTATSVRVNGATQEFTSGSSSLTFGGQAATFTGKYHLSTLDGTMLYLEQKGE